MSHFALGVIIPREISQDDGQIISYLEDLLGPYDQNMEVTPYEQPCSCKDFRIGNDARDYATRVVGDIHKLHGFKREAQALVEQGLHRTHESHKSDPSFWEEQIRLHEQTRRDYRETNYHNYIFDPKCYDCHGTGVYTTTYNPKSQWDYWTIGGRWDGVLSRIVPNDTYWGHAPIYRNKIKISNFLRRKHENNSFFALLTEQEGWLEQGQMKAFGMSANNAPLNVWNEKVFEICAKYRKDSLIMIDCHI